MNDEAGADGGAVEEREFSGTLFVQGDKAWMETGGDGRIVTIDDPSLLDRLLKEVPCYVGGPYLYWDDVVLTGRLATSAKIQTIRSVGTVKLLRPDEGAYLF